MRDLSYDEVEFVSGGAECSDCIEVCVPTPGGEICFSVCWTYQC
jgi:hypothetical protein